MIRPTSRKSSSSKPRIVAAGVPIRTPEATVGGRSSNGTVLRFVVSLTAWSRSSASLPVHSVRRRSSWSRCVSVPPVRTSRPPSMISAASASAFGAHPRLVLAERLGRGDLEAGRLGGDRVLQRASLQPREDGTVDRRGVLLAAEDEAGPRAGERLVGGRGDHVAVGHGVRVQAGRDEPREVRHVAPEERADLVRDLAELPRLDGARVGGAAAQDHLRAVLLGERQHLVVVDAARLPRDAVVNDRVEPPREVDLEPVGQMAAVVEPERQHRVARLHQARDTPPCSPARPHGAGRSRARPGRAPWPGRSPAARSDRRSRSRRSTACPGIPPRTCSSAPSRPPRGSTAT